MSAPLAGVRRGPAATAAAAAGPHSSPSQGARARAGIVGEKTRWKTGFGTALLQNKNLTGLINRVNREGMTVAFGAPGRGLPTILGSSPKEILGPHDSGSKFDCWLNTIPNQSSETVRTEEAMIASLALLSL